jgi:hypothetical protein
MPATLKIMSYFTSFRIRGPRFLHEKFPTTLQSTFFTPSPSSLHPAFPSLTPLIPTLTNPPYRAYFPLFTFLELTLHLPLTLYFIRVLPSPRLSRSPTLPLWLLVFALETTITTATCLAEMWSWPGLTAAQKGVQGLGGMYGGYLVLGCVMCVDAFARVRRGLVEGGGAKKKTL